MSTGSLLLHLSSQERFGHENSSGDPERPRGNRPGEQTRTIWQYFSEAQNLDLYQSYKNVLQIQISIFQEILQHLDAATDEWGIRVERVEVRVILHIPNICHFFTLAKFLENKIYTEKGVNYDKIHSKLPNFCVITAKYTVNCQFFALNL